ncbi:hypothetical protein [Breoghania sp.]|uniref:hypothetical protein n=1 Tax=Breoghania sp. TaxID=2065378 RepID=UPI002AA5E432|nr:hypothetical protein [Breoghania sp.]
MLRLVTISAFLFLGIACHADEVTRPIEFYPGIHIGQSIETAEKQIGWYRCGHGNEVLLCSDNVNVFGLNGDVRIRFINGKVYSAKNLIRDKDAFEKYLSFMLRLDRSIVNIDIVQLSTSNTEIDIIKSIHDLEPEEFSRSLSIYNEKPFIGSLRSVMFAVSPLAEKRSYVDKADYLESLPPDGMIVYLEKHSDAGSRNLTTLDYWITPSARKKYFAEWSRDPENAAAASDDLGVLSMLVPLSRQAEKARRMEAEARRAERLKEHEKWGLTDPASTPEEEGPLSWVDTAVDHLRAENSTKPETSMSEFEAQMINNLFKYDLLLIIINIAAFVVISRALGRGFIRSILAIFFSFVANLIIASASIFVVALILVPNFLAGAMASPSGAIAWSLEAGIQYGLLALLISPLLHIGYLIFRRRAQKTERNADHSMERP